MNGKISWTVVTTSLMIIITEGFPIDLQTNVRSLPFVYDYQGEQRVTNWICCDVPPPADCVKSLNGKECSMCKPCLPPAYMSANLDEKQQNQKGIKHVHLNGDASECTCQKNKGKTKKPNKQTTRRPKSTTKNQFQDSTEETVEESTEESTEETTEKSKKTTRKPHRRKTTTSRYRKQTSTKRHRKKSTEESEEETTEEITDESTDNQKPGRKFTTKKPSSKPRFTIKPNEGIKKNDTVFYYDDGDHMYVFHYNADDKNSFSYHTDDDKTHVYIG